MANLYETDSDHITFHAKENYSGLARAHVRAMTISGFRVAQNTDKISLAPMRRDVLTFLLSPRAVSHWIARDWLTVVGKNDEGKSLVRLTRAGLGECDSSLLGYGAWETDQMMISEWVKRMLHGRRITNRTKKFDFRL